jgi:hypothetical protein
MRFASVTLGIVTACKFTHGQRATDGGVIDVVDGPPDAGKCMGASKECLGDTLRECAGSGSDAIDTMCNWGCLTGMGAPHCAQVVPAGSGNTMGNGVKVTDVESTDLLDVTLTDATIDGDDGQVGTSGDANFYHGGNTGIEKGIDFQFRGDVSMFRFKSVTINNTLKLVGLRPIAIVADGPIVINGVIDGRGPCTTNLAGPGGYVGGNSQGVDGAEPTSTSGGGQGASSAANSGGGGGYGTAGGSGDGRAGGTPYGDAIITKLLGGAGGGAGDGGGSFGKGGGGGGAVQFVSNTRLVVMTGGVNAGGCGGQPGTGANDSGGGGGAGGTILIEAPIVIINGALAVNGGGGGGGGGGGAMAGGSGSLDRTPAPGGHGQANEGDQDGGAGAAGSAGAGSGSSSGTNPGGGGGGLGRIRINTKSGSADIGSAVLSPSPTDPSTTCTIDKAKTQ